MIAPIVKLPFDDLDGKTIQYSIGGNDGVGKLIVYPEHEDGRPTGFGKIEIHTDAPGPSVRITFLAEDLASQIKLHKVPSVADYELTDDSYFIKMRVPVSKP